VDRPAARLGQRAHWIGEDQLVFPGELGGHLDTSALRRRYDGALTRAGLRRPRFHDLRHTFGTRMIARADVRRVQEWMGHADIQATMRYCTTRHGTTMLPWSPMRSAASRPPRRRPSTLPLHDDQDAADRRCGFRRYRNATMPTAGASRAAGELATASSSRTPPERAGASRVASL
jgi:hypothetical protein